MKVLNKILLTSAIVYLIPQTSTALTLYGLYTLFNNNNIQDVRRNLCDIIDGINYVILENTK
jgi:hypothetical protein